MKVNYPYNFCFQNQCSTFLFYFLMWCHVTPTKHVIILFGYISHLQNFFKAFLTFSISHLMDILPVKMLSYVSYFLHSNWLEKIITGPMLDTSHNSSCFPIKLTLKPKYSIENKHYLCVLEPHLLHRCITCAIYDLLIYSL